MPEGVVDSVCYSAGLVCGKIGRLINVATCKEEHEDAKIASNSGEEHLREILDPSFEKEIAKIDGEIREDWKVFAKTKEERVRHCDRQLRSLYTHFGKLIHENVEKGNVYYCFVSESAELEEKASALVACIIRHQDRANARQAQSLPRKAGTQRIGCEAIVKAGTT